MAEQLDHILGQPEPRLQEQESLLLLKNYSCQGILFHDTLI